MKREKKLNHRNCTMKYHKTHDVQHLIDGINVIARGKYDHIYHEVKEKIRTAMRKLINLTKENYTMNKQIIKGQRDSLGVPIEPDEYEVYVVAYDWLGNAIYSDEEYEYILFQGDLIRYENSYADRYLLDMDAVIYSASELEGLKR